MSATVCTCIRHANRLCVVAVPDPDCPACTRRAEIALGTWEGDQTITSAQADHDAQRTATGLGWLLVFLTAITIAAVGIVAASLWPGTWRSAAGFLLAVTAVAVPLYFALTSKEDR